MAARRLLIVMLILLGLSTLAAALVPQHGLRGTSSTGPTTTAPQPTTTTTATPAGRQLYETISITHKKSPVVVVAGPICPHDKRKPCLPAIHTGDQLALSVYTDHG